MTILKLKAIFYRYTGIYLAHKEELEYITSDEGWSEFCKLLDDKEMSPKNAQGLLIGLWQAELGFDRPLLLYSLTKRPKWFWRVIAWVHCFGRVLRWDLFFSQRP